MSNYYTRRRDMILAKLKARFPRGRIRGWRMVTKYPGLRYQGRRRLPLRKMPKSVLPEIKRRDNYYASPSLESTSGTVYQTSLFTSIPVGDAFNERTGSKVFIKYVTFKILVVPSATVTWNAWRIAFHIDKEPMASTYAAGIPWTTMYQDTGNVTNNLNAPPNQTLVGRLKIVKELFSIKSPHLLQVSGGPDPTPITSVQANPPIRYTFKIPINKVVHYGNGTNEIQSGVKLYLTGWSNQNGAAAPIMYAVARTYFTDA